MTSIGALELIRGLWRYHGWANRRLFGVAATLGDEAVERRMGTQFSLPTLKEMFGHIDYRTVLARA